MKVQIPNLLANRLGQDAAIQAAVNATLNRFEPLVASSQMPFFPDFTDHGIEHLNRVLRLAELTILREKGDLPEAFSAADAGVLLLAVLLHDLGMHLTEEGFLRLLDQANPWPRIETLDFRTWPELWEEFFSEATHWDDRTIVAHFGEELAKRTETRPLIRRPEEISTYAWDPLDKRLIGEFVRRQHSRLAHEIARFGMPGPEEDRLETRGPDGFPEFTDLAGFVARSHGMDLRDTFDYLRQVGSHREFRLIHPIFVMTVLRISDFLDLYAERAPRALQLVKRHKSKTSKQEWSAHQAIRDIAFDTEDDPELLRFTAKPENIRTYLRIRQWQDNLQAELDQSWAVLGEVYGRHEQSRRLGLTIRRVRSNLDATDFPDTIDYIPKRISFGVARTEILGLLVRPLYGDRPEIGIRELMQNSIDAVRERVAFQERHPEYKGAELRAQESELVVWVGKVRDGKTWAEVSDRGIGMTEDIICNYFLKAGGSFRNSPWWKREFATAGEPTLPGGKSLDANRHRVLRSGRFGIGVFAAFLLGDRLVVETRHITSKPDNGLRFSVDLDSDVIEMEKCEVPVGTSIHVEITPATLRRLVSRVALWDWYGEAEPSHARRVGERGTAVPSRAVAAVFSSQGGVKDWHEVSSRSYAGVRWRWAGDSRGLLCNGIWISRRSLIGRQPFLNLDYTPYYFEWFLISLQDYEGILPINLTRDALVSEPGVFEEIRLDMLRHFIDFLVKTLPERKDGTLLSQAWDGFCALRSFRGLVGERRSRSPWGPLVTRDGYSLLWRESVERAGLERILAVGVGPDRFGTRALRKLSKFLWEEEVEALAFFEMGRDSGFVGLQELLDVPRIGRAFPPRNGEVLTWWTPVADIVFREAMAADWLRAEYSGSAGGNWLRLQRGIAPGKAIQENRLVAKELKESRRFLSQSGVVVLEMSLSPNQSGYQGEKSLLSNVWWERVKGISIPFSLGDRR